MSSSSGILVVTGASGFVGRQIVPLLAAKGLKLVLVGRDPAALKIQFPQLETCSYETLSESAKGADALLHLAVLNNDKSASLEQFQAVNVDLLRQVVRDCKQAGVPQIIYPGSLHSSTKQTFYAQSKKDAERFLDDVAGIKVTRIRLPAVYGDGVYAGNLRILKAVPKFGRNIVLQILASLRPCVHVRHLADQIYKLVHAPQSEDVLISDQQMNNKVYGAITRLIDFGFALGVILVFWWLLVLAWLAVIVTSKGPGIFAQKRVGQLGNDFTCYKFRTMAQGTKQAGTHEVSASAVTSVGKFLRASKIDELPQVLNILKGEISLVGPRPCLPVQTELLDARRSRGILDIRPGITGYAQMKGVDMSEPQKLAALEYEYLCLRNIPLDLKIILATLLRRQI